MTESIDSDHPSSRVAGGTLYVVPTPIGNLGDLSPRALQVLSAVDLIAAEDTRTTGAMLAHFGVRARMVALHEHNETEVIGSLLAQLAEGRSLALVSDAGTPLVSDPGYRLLNAVREGEVPVVAIPGPCAAIAALSVSGLPCDAFTFAGFPPPKSAARRAWLGERAHWPHSLLLYEASHRILGLAGDLPGALGGERIVALSREISKRFEQHWRGPAAELEAWLRADSDRQRGEFVVAIGPGPAVDERARLDALLEPLLRELESSRAARVAAEALGLRRNAVYQRALELSASADDAG